MKLRTFLLSTLAFALFGAAAAFAITDPSTSSLKVDANGNVLPTTYNSHPLNLPPNTTLNGSPIGSPAWGNITGTLSGQTDLNTALSAKAALTGANFSLNGLKHGGTVVEAYAFRDLASLVSDWTGSVINGLTAGSAAQNIYSSGTTRSATHFAHSIDLTCISLQTVGNWQAVAISPRHIVTANHIGPANGTTVSFVDSTGATISRTLSSSSRIGVTDIQIGYLSADLPATVKPAKVLSASQEALLINGTPIVYNDQNQKLYIGERAVADLTTFQLNQAGTSPRSTFWKSGGPISGDSGSAIGTVIDGEWVALSEMHSGSPTSCSGDSIAKNYAAVNAAMAAFGSSYQLTKISARAFSDFSNANSAGLVFKDAAGHSFADTSSHASVADALVDLEDPGSDAMAFDSGGAPTWWVENAPDFRTAIGLGSAALVNSTTVGAAFMGLTNPSAITFPRINANNTVTALSAQTFAGAIGLGWISDNGANIVNKAASYGLVGNDGTLQAFYDTDIPGWSINDPHSFVKTLGGGSDGKWTDANLASSVKPAVAVVATSNLTLSGEQTIDGQLTSGSLVLATAQSTGANNGPWVSAAGAWARPTWYTNGSTSQAPQFLTTFVRLGTTYQGSTWRMTTASVTIGTTATTWVQTPTNLNSVTGTISGASVSGGTLGATNGANVTALTAANITASTTAGRAILNLTNPSAISFVKIAADNSVSTRTPAQVLSDIGAQASGSYAASGANSDITSLSGLTGAVVTTSAGTAALPSLALRSTGMGWYSPSSGEVALSIAGAAAGIDLSNNGRVFLTTNGGYLSIGASDDLHFARNAAGVAEINNGTAGAPGALIMAQAPAANTVATGLTLTDTTAATSGNQQYSGAILQTGQGWKTTSTAASQSVSFRNYVVPVQGTSAPTGNWVLESSINGGSFAQPIYWSSTGFLKLGGLTSSFPALTYSGNTLQVWTANESGLAGFRANSINADNAIQFTNSIYFDSPTDGKVVFHNSTNTQNAGIIAGRIVTAKTANYNVSATTDAGTFFTNVGASGTVIFTLPTAAVGLTYTFYVDAAQTLEVLAGASTTIQVAGSTSASAGNITNATQGGCITLVAISTTKWVTQAHEGTWTVN